jgi:hypothetical protein
MSVAVAVTLRSPLPPPADLAPIDDHVVGVHSAVDFDGPKVEVLDSHCRSARSGYSSGFTAARGTIGLVNAPNSANRCGRPSYLALRRALARSTDRVAATRVNYMDVYGGEGRRPYARNLPFVPGGEGADTVVGLGNGVDSAAVEHQALDHKEAT